MDPFLDDPTPLVEQLEAAWSSYVAAGPQTYVDIEREVVEWRFTDDDLWIPRHPFSAAFEIDEHSNWRPRPIRFVDEDPDEIQMRHGFDALGRVVIAGRWVIRYDDGFHDILGLHRKRDPKTRELSESRLPYQPHYKSGFPVGGFRRCWTDEAGRIVRTGRLSNEGDEPGRHYRSFEQFHRHDDRITQSFRQFFTRATEPGEQVRDLPPDELAKKDRRIHETLREVMMMRSRFEYSYDKTGVLSQVAEYKSDGKLSEVLYSFQPGDTIEKLTAELAAVIEKALVKAIKAAKAARPLRTVALQYSAEHAHCGLPAVIRLVSAEDSTDPLDWETYPHTASWPPEGRIGKKYDDLQCRLQIAVEASPQYAEDFQPRPYREVLWKACRGVYERLARKQLTTDDFAVFPLDDHGDVDPAEDVRESLPADVADRLLQRAGIS